MKTSFNERDEFKRKTIAENLLKIIQSDIDISPAIIDAPWGAGKTEFCHKTIDLFNNSSDEIKTLYLDAFKYDHTDDPLLMLLTGISSLLEDQPQSKKNLLERSIPVAKTLSKFILKAGASWILKQNADELGKELGDSIESSSGEVIDNGIKEVFRDFEKLEENLELLKETLTEISKKSPLVIFIDELDRCRPSFALSLIEKVKHIFDIPNITFIFSTNFNQLTAIVKKEYGAEIDATNYLRKFFNYEIILSNSLPNYMYNFKQNASVILSQFLMNNEATKIVCGRSKSIEDFFFKLFLLHNRSLRDAERFCRNIEIYGTLKNPRTINELSWGRALITLLGVYLYTFDTKLTDRIVKNSYGKIDIANYFGVTIEAINNAPNNGGDLPLVSVVSAIFIQNIPHSRLHDPFSKDISHNLNERIKGLFNQEGFIPDRQEKVDICSEAVKVMQLSV